MSKLATKHIHALLTLLLGVAVVLFWRLAYPQALSYQEQFQLFLFTGDYLASRLAVPGGLARYVAEFLVQFYNNITVGAILLGLMLMLVQRLTWRATGRQVPYALSFLPAVLLWQAMGDESVMLTYTVALAIALAMALASPRQGYARWAYTAIAMPLLYWAIGPMAMLTALLTMPLAVVYVVACLLASAWLVPYPLTRLWLGIGYYRYPETLPYMLIAIPLLIVALRYGRRWIPSGRKAVEAIALAATAAVAAVVVPMGYDQRKYDLIAYDYLVRLKNWDAIVAKAEQRHPDLPMSVAATNLALAMKGQLGDRALDFYQHGSEGLLPRFERNFNTAQLTGEVYFQLGLVNTAQRLAFEAMEALPDYNKSARVMKRLAETNLVNGQYGVARKYLHLLQQTMFYRPWALRTEAMLGNEEQIDSHPLYGRLRQYKIEDDYLFSQQETDKICGQLFIHHPQNAMAMQYLLMLPLLDGDLPRLARYYRVVQQRTAYTPRCVMKALNQPLP